MKRFFLILLFFVPLSSLTFEEELTLDEALKKAVEQNKLLNAAKSAIMEAEGIKKVGFSYRLPQIDLAIDYSRTDNPAYVFMGKVNQGRFSMMDFSVDKLKNPPPLDNYEGKVSLTMPIFTGGKINAINRASNFGIEVSKNRYKDAIERLKKGVIEAFYGAILANKQVSVYEEALKTARSHEEQIVAMHKEGLVLDSDLMRIRVYRSDVEQQLSLKKAEFESAKSYLAYAIGVDYQVTPKGELENYETINMQLEDLLKKGETNNYELLALLNLLNQAKEGIKISKSDYFPQIGFIASYQRDYAENGTYGKSWMIGVGVKIPIFDGGRREGSLLQAKSDEIGANYMYQDTKLRIDTEIKSSYLKLKSLEERLNVTKSQVEQAEENQRIISKRYEEGMALITELLDADILVTSTKLSRAKAYFDVILEKANLIRLIGGENNLDNKE